MQEFGNFAAALEQKAKHSFPSAAEAIGVPRYRGNWLGGWAQSGRTRELSAASREAAAAMGSPRGSRAGSIMSGMSPGFLRKGSSFSKK